MNLTLWTQGDIRILVNRETKGYASSAFAVHGTSVCDIGIAVERCKSGSRARQIAGCRPLQQPIDPGN